MAPAAGQKRVKNKRIERPFIIGSEAWPLDSTNRKPETPTDHTKGWRVYVKVPEDQPDITRWLKKVQFKIFHTYPNPQRIIEAPGPFVVEETGWGGFNVDIRLHFAPEVSSKPEYRSHFLQLEHYGDEAMQARQREEKIVRSEFLEYIEFNEPTEALWEALTDEGQFPTKKGSSRGKGKLREEEGEGTVELPSSASRTNPFSKDLEGQVLDSLKKAEAQVEALLSEEKKREQEAHSQLMELRGAATA